MAKKADTWMPLYVGEYLADTTNLNTEQHGAYCLMLMAAWKKGGTLPDDDQQLAAITKLSVGRWKSHRSILVDFFSEVDGGLSHKRVTAERLKAQAISDKKSSAGSEGAAKRWGIDGEEHGDGMADAMAHAMAEAMAPAMANASQTNAPSPSPLPTPAELVLEPTGSPSTAGPPTCPQIRLLDLFAERLGDLPQPKPELWTKGKSAAALQARWKWLMSAKRRNGERYAVTTEDGVSWFGRFFDFVASSDFLMGRTAAAFRCSLGWLVKAENFEKVVQGNYVNKENQ